MCCIMLYYCYYYYYLNYYYYYYFYYYCYNYTIQMKLSFWSVFDNVSYAKSIRKLLANGIRKDLLRWISNNFTDRMQAVGLTIYYCSFYPSPVEFRRVLLRGLYFYALCQRFPQTYSCFN